MAPPPLLIIIHLHVTESPPPRPPACSRLCAPSFIIVRTKIIQVIVKPVYLNNLLNLRDQCCTYYCSTSTVYRNSTTTNAILFTEDK